MKSPDCSQEPAKSSFAVTRVTIKVRNCGPIGAFKNMKRAFHSEKLNRSFLVTEGKAKKRMNKIIQCIASQLSSASKTGTAAILTDASPPFSTACVPHDDAWTWIPQIHINAVLCEQPEDEGCDIIIERIG